MVYDSMAAWDKNTFEFADAIQSRGFSWSGNFSFEYGPGSTISRDDYVHPSRPTTPEEAEHITDKAYTSSPSGSPQPSPPSSPRVDSAKSFVDSAPSSPGMSDKEKTRLADRLYTAACEGSLDDIRQLIDIGAPINTPTLVRGLYETFKPPKPGILSPLAGAAANGHLDAVELLIAEGAVLNPDMQQSSSAPIHLACKANDLEIVRLLLELGADVDALNCWKTTPLMYAVKYGSPELVTLVLSYKPDLGITSFISTAAIHWAVWPNHERTMELMLEAGANPNHTMGDGSTPLHCAAGSGLTGVVKILLKGGSDWRRRNHDHCRAVRVAEVAGHEETAEVLRAAEKESTSSA